MKTTISILVVLINFDLYAQSVVIAESESAIGDGSAILDVQSETKGFLFPRVALESLTSADPITDPAEGLFVFSKDGTVPDGIYYWEGSEWVSFLKSNANPVPAGTIVSFGGDAANVPDGWLLCDGNAYSQNDYPALFGAIGSNWGGSGTIFNVPDFRGYFLRGADLGAGNDPDASVRTSIAGGGNAGDAVGSVQNDAFQGHFHNPLSPINSFVGGGGAGLVVTGPSFGTASTTGPPVDDGTNGVPRTTEETRPKNAYVNYIIKY